MTTAPAAESSAEVAAAEISNAEQAEAQPLIWLAQGGTALLTVVFGALWWRTRTRRAA
jgi:hypothetical protein